jgi:hypothetical protein
VLHSFDREDELDRAAIERLIASLRRLLDADLGKRHIPSPEPALSCGTQDRASTRLPSSTHHLNADQPTRSAAERRPGGRIRAVSFPFEDAVRMTRYFHTTDAAEAIFRDGFRDAEGLYMLRNTKLRGVFLADSHWTSTKMRSATRSSPWSSAIPLMSGS